jgi:iron(III) transport system substrate-binding protein
MRINPLSTRLAMTLVLMSLLAACSPAAAPPAAPTSAPAAKEGAGAQWEQTLQAARKEGSVTVVTHTNLLYRETIARFSEKYPDISVEHVAIRPSEFAPKVVTEQQNGTFGYDLWVSSSSNMVEVVLPTGGFDKLTPYLLLPEVTEGKNWRTGSLLWATNEPYIVLNRANVGGSVWVNRDRLPASEFSNVEQILEPKFKGKLMIRTPNAPQGSTLAMSGWLHSKGEDFIWKAMKDQEPVYIENARLLTQNLINGKYPLAIGTDGATIDNCKQAGGCQTLEEVRGLEYILGHGVSMLKKAPHPNAAAVFANWFLSKEGQEAFKQGIVSTEPSGQDAHSIRADVEPNADAVAVGSVPDYAHIGQYSMQGMEQGAIEMQKVIELYRKVEAGESR